VTDGGRDAPEPQPSDRRPDEPPRLAEDSPTELVETERGELIERLSGGTATLLLIWLIGIGAGSALLAAWIFAEVVAGQRLGIGALFSGFGLYVGLFGAAGPTVLWLSGRAQGHSLPWFIWTAAKMGLTMIGIVIGVAVVGILILGGGIGTGHLILAALLIAITLVLSLTWALATWSADRYIARARIEGE
jgi:hypothetical protein